MTTILNYFGKSIKENELLFYAVENVDVCLKSKLRGGAKMAEE